GMDADFAANRLFRPFDTTKGSQGMGVGAYQTREFVRAAGGEVDVVTAPGEGTTFKITLPLYESGKQGAADGKPAARHPVRGKRPQVPGT
nr:hypothetical protein [Gammaproteobacteria bacterium]